MNGGILIAPLTRMWKGQKKVLHYAAVRDILELFDLSGGTASPRDEKGDKNGGHVGCEGRQWPSELLHLVEMTHKNSFNRRMEAAARFFFFHFYWNSIVSLTHLDKHSFPWEFRASSRTPHRLRLHISTVRGGQIFGFFFFQFFPNTNQMCESVKRKADLATTVFFFFFHCSFYISGGWTDSLGREAFGFHQESLLPQRWI